MGIHSDRCGVQHGQSGCVIPPSQGQRFWDEHVTQVTARLGAGFLPELLEGGGSLFLSDRLEVGGT